VVDDFACIRMTAGDIRAIQSDPEMFGLVPQTVVEHYPHLLREDSLQHGARTIRLLTQLAVEVHVEQVIRHLAKGIRQLLRKYRAKQIQPVLVGSSGGGTGSALIPLLGSCFAQEEFLRRVAQGMRVGIIHRPLVVVADPIAYADSVSDRQAHKILGNSKAFRIEMDLLDRQHGAFQHVLHQGLANAGGAVFDRREEVCKQLGIAVYQLCRHWQSFFKPSLVNGSEGHDPNDRYRGHNIPERYLPASVHPPFASKLPRRRLRRRITLTNGFEPPRDAHEPTNGFEPGRDGHEQDS
jgi:hypothetical protein